MKENKNNLKPVWKKSNEHTPQKVNENPYQQNTNKSYYKLIRPISNIIEEEKTLSDKILSKTKKR